MFTRTINLNINLKGYDMATLEDISTALATLTTAVNGLPAAIVAALPPQGAVDTAAIEAAITAGTAAVIAEIKSGVEGVAPAPAPAA